MASDMDPKSQANAMSDSRSDPRHELEGLCHHDHAHEGHKFRHHDNSLEENISIPSNSRHAEQAIAPFLAKHIPTQYNPVGHLVPQSTNTDLDHDHHQDTSSTKFCYRHRPDLKCRRQANEPSMEQLQNVSRYLLSAIDSLYADMSIGTRYRLSIRPTSHLPCLVPLLRRPFQAPQSHAPGHPLAMLFSPTLLHLRFRSRPDQDRLPFCPAARARLQNPLLPRHYFAVQGRSSQSTLEKPCRRRRRLAQNV